MSTLLKVLQLITALLSLIKEGYYLILRKQRESDVKVITNPEEDKQSKLDALDRLRK